MNHRDKKELQKCHNAVIQSNDPAFNYSFIPQDDIDNFEKCPDIIQLSQYDYSCKRDDGDDFRLPKLTPASLLMSSNSLEEMEAWYAKKFCDLPDEYHGIMARYSLGIPITKKETKNELKKMAKKNKEPSVGFKVTQGKYTVVFD